MGRLPLRGTLNRGGLQSSLGLPHSSGGGGQMCLQPWPRAFVPAGLPPHQGLELDDGSAGRPSLPRAQATTSGGRQAGLPLSPTQLSPLSGQPWTSAAPWVSPALTWGPAHQLLWPPDLGTGSLPVTWDRPHCAAGPGGRVARPPP